MFLSYLSKFFKPVQDLAKMTNTIAQTAVGVERVRAILEADDVIPEQPDAREPAAVSQGEIDIRECGLRAISADVGSVEGCELSRSRPGRWWALWGRPEAANPRS